MRRADMLTEFALFFEMGAGKTATAINIVRKKMNEAQRFLRVLVLSPPATLDNWKKEWHANSELPLDKVHVLRGTSGQRLDTFVEHGFAREHHTQRNKWTSRGHVFITNYESLQMPGLWKELVYWRPEVIIFDEAQRLKDPQAKRTKAAIKLADEAQYRYVLTGTPILNSLMDLYALFRILDRGETFGHSYVFFRAKYFYDKNAARARRPGYFPAWAQRDDSAVELRRKIEAKSMRIEKSECLDLPPLIRKEVSVELSAEQARLYAEMSRDYITFVGGDACNAPLAVTRALRLLQIVSGFVALEKFTEFQAEKRNLAFADNPRAVELERVLTEIFSYPGSKVLIWAVFRENYATIRKVLEKLGVRWVEVHGEISVAAKRIGLEAFEAERDCRALIGHPLSAGVGLNLQVAGWSIYYSRQFSLEADLQSEARNHRGGSEKLHKTITRIDLVARGTIDEFVLERLREKIGVSESVLKDLGKRMEELIDGSGEDSPKRPGRRRQ